MCLIGSIDQHHREMGASLNKAVHILAWPKAPISNAWPHSKPAAFPGAYDFSLKKAWANFKPVAHLCAAYVTTGTHYYHEELERDFLAY
jgi:hypothetical protein